MKPLEFAVSYLSSKPNTAEDLVGLLHTELPDDERFQTIKNGNATLVKRQRSRIVAFVESPLGDSVIGTIALGERGHRPACVKQGRWVSASGDKCAVWNYHTAHIDPSDWWAVDCVVSQGFLGKGVHIALLEKFDELARARCAGQVVYFHTDNPEVRAFCIVQGWEVAFVPAAGTSLAAGWVMSRQF